MQFFKFQNKEEGFLAVTLLVVAFSAPLYYSDLNFDFIKNIKNSAQSVRVFEKEALQPKPALVLLGRAEVSYAGGVPNRNSNIELGVAKLNGVVVANGAEFSFLESLGPVLIENGFKEAKSFLNGEVVLGLGGGLCHVSTTLFQSILKAGLLITERHHHTFPVAFYQPGLDATISNLGPDLKFINDTGNDILIKGYTENLVAIFEIYGISDGRKSVVHTPKLSNFSLLPETSFIYNPNLNSEQKICENIPTQGFTAVFDYEVLFPNGEKRLKKFTSNYKPLGRVCQVGIPNLADFTGCTETSLFSRVTGNKCPEVFSR